MIKQVRGVESDCRTDLETVQRLEHEACLIGDYLVQTLIPAEMAKRYAEANLALLVTSETRLDRYLMDFIHRHPEALGYLDTAGGLVDRRSLLRRKILIAAAVLETSTDFATEFLPRSLSLSKTLRVLAAAGLRTILQSLVGLALYAWLRLKVRWER